MGPLEDCYRPDLVPPDGDVRSEQREHARRLADAGADLLLIETMGTAGEAFLAAEAAKETGLEFMVSLLAQEDGRLFDGTELSVAVNRIAPLGPAAIAINCLPARRVDGALGSLLAALSALPPDSRPAAGVYANAGLVGGDPSLPMICDVLPGEYASTALGWMERGVRMIGGCCGTAPEHISALKQLLA